MRNEDRRRHRRLKKIRKKRIKKRLLFILSMLCVFFIAWIFIKAFAGKAKKDGPGIKPEKKSESKQEENKIENTLEERILETIKNSNLDLEKRLNELISKEKIRKENISLTYLSLEDGHSFSINGDKYHRMSRSNNFALYMLYDDLLREKKINPNKEVKVEIELEGPPITKKTEIYTIDSLISSQIKDAKDEYYEAIKKEIELASKTNWITDINRRYNLEIENEFNMTTEKNTELLKKLAEKRNGKYIYEGVINRFISKPSKDKAVMKIREKAIMGFMSGNYYEAYMDMGIIFGKHPYAYAIVSIENKPELNSNILDVINSWHDMHR